MFTGNSSEEKVKHKFRCNKCCVIHLISECPICKSKEVTPIEIHVQYDRKSVKYKQETIDEEHHHHLEIS